MKVYTDQERKNLYLNLYRQVKEGKTDKPSDKPLSKDDPIEVWISGYLNSDNPNLKNKSNEEKTKIAVGAYYGSQKGEQPGFEGIIPSEHKASDSLGESIICESGPSEGDFVTWSKKAPTKQFSVDAIDGHTAWLSDDDGEEYEADINDLEVVEENMDIDKSAELEEAAGAELTEDGKRMILQRVNGIIDFIDSEMKGSTVDFTAAYNYWIHHESADFISEDLREIIGDSFDV